MASERWLEASEVIPMFPTLVWKFLLEAGLRSAIDAKILATLERMRRELPQLAPGQGWQSEQTLHGREEFGQLAACVGNAAKSILRFLRVGDEAGEITGCWATGLAVGAVHKAHSHPNNFLSGVYYVRTRPGSDAINFHDPRTQAAVIRPPVVELTAENTEDRKSTRLNSSHLGISYAVFCLKKKNKQVQSAAADNVNDADHNFFACLVRFESASYDTTVTSSYYVCFLDGRSCGCYYNVRVVV